MFLPLSGVVYATIADAYYYYNCRPCAFTAKKQKKKKKSFHICVRRSTYMDATYIYRPLGNKT